MTPTISRKTASQLQSTRWATMCSALLLAACANISTQAPDIQAKQRANARWQALVAGKFEAAYTFSTPGFRALVTPEAYRGRIGSAVKWVGAEVNKVNCPQPDKCDVQIRLDYKPLLGSMGGDNYTAYIDESWLLENGQWWIYQPIGK